jgi:hypothetical protein
MTKNSTVIPLRQPEAVDDPLTAVLRSGAAGCFHKPSRRKPRRFWP